ncbi:PREDICTED: PRA1 family protein G2-like [Camelina sativa]|uniref:PRA1 family protein n=1 Tax=Camelina sativa TaxID=90675 RepID=A0ABM0XAJ6_CAMSA|nr:PREDICTED: PRA1 family protein G2-like [Camelina sativa]
MTPPPTTTTTTYTSIPIPTGDVISRSIHNLTTTISRHRPWSELVFSGDYSLPWRFSSLLLRLKTNYHYFFVNYAIVVAVCAALALITASPVALIVVGTVVSLWVLFHFFREDPLILWSFQVGDRTVVVFLVLASVWALWFTSSAVNLAVGVGVGLLFCIIHVFIRNSDERFLEEDDAVTGGLIGSNRR